MAPAPFSPAVPWAQSVGTRSPATTPWAANTAGAGSITHLCIEQREKFLINFSSPALSARPGDAEPAIGLRAASDRRKRRGEPAGPPPAPWPSQTDGGKRFSQLLPCSPGTRAGPGGPGAGAGGGAPGPGPAPPLSPRPSRPAPLASLSRRPPRPTAIGGRGGR